MRGEVLLRAVGADEADRHRCHRQPLRASREPQECHRGSWHLRRSAVAAGTTDDQGATALATLSIVTGCYNEEDNVAELVARVRAVLESLTDYRYEHIFIDNASTDRTVAVLREICATTPGSR